MYYGVTERMKALFNSRQKQTIEISVELKDGSTAEDFKITEQDIKANSFSVDRYSATGENLEIGSAVAAEIKFDLDNSSGKFDNIHLGGAKLFVRLGIKDGSDESSTSEFMDCGYFTVDENPKPLEVISVAALDNMMKFDKAVNWSNFSFPMSIENTLNVCCDACEVTLSPSVSFESLPNGSYVISSVPETSGITYRQLVQWIAEITGTCAWADWNGHLRLSWCENTDIVISPSDRFSSSTEDAITVTGVQITESEDEKYLCGEEGFVFNIEGNELIQNNREAVAQNLCNALAGFTYVPFESTGFPMPYLYPLDMISFVTLKGEIFQTVVTAHVYSLNGTSNLKASGESQEKQNYSVSSPFTKRESAIIKQLQKESKRQLHKLEKDTLDLNNSLIYALGLYSTKVKHEDGSETQYLHSKERLEDCVDGDVIFCLNAGGFGICTSWDEDGNPIFENGFDVKGGKAIWQYLSANTINANLIKAGQITSADGTTFFNLDKGQIGTTVTEMNENGEEVVKYSYLQDAEGVNLETGLAITFEEFESNMTDEEKAEVKKEEDKYTGAFAIFGKINAVKKKYDLWRKRLKGYQISTFDMLKGKLHYFNFSSNKAFFTRLFVDNEGNSQRDVTEFSVDGIKSNKRLKIDAPGIDLPWVVLPSGTDFDTVLTPGDYSGDVVLGDGTNSNYLNSPTAIAAAFSLEVIPTGRSNQRLQRLTLSSKGYSRKWERHYHSGSWGAWYCTYSDRNTVLWSGAYYMNADQTITLSEPISRQPSGIILSFSPYENNTAGDHNFNRFYISKYDVLTHGGSSGTFTMFRNLFSMIATKTLYISDQTIKGHANNVASGTQNGITYNGKNWVLREVVGV